MKNRKFKIFILGLYFAVFYGFIGLVLWRQFWQAAGFTLAIYYTLVLIIFLLNKYEKH